MEPVIISSNPECLKILTEIGIVDKLVPEPPYNRAHAFFDYPKVDSKYHCVATYDKGHANEADNGFMIVMLPLDKLSHKDAHAVLEDLMDLTQAAPGGVMREVYIGDHLQ